MTKNSVLMIVAGAAMSIAAPALAQNAGLDQDRAYAAEMMADASGRASLLQGGAGGAGHDGKNFFLSDATGNNKLTIGGDAHFFYHTSFRSDNTGADNDFTHGFQNTLTRFRFAGNVWDKALTFKVQAYLNNAGSIGLQDAWGKYTWDNNFFAQWGQFRAPLTREYLVDENHQLAAYPSQNNNFFNQSYSQGLMIGYTAEQFRFMASFTDGFRTAMTGSAMNTPFNSSSEADWAFAGRVEMKFGEGEWARYNDFTSFQGSEGVGFMFGGAVGYQSFGDTGPGGADVIDWTYTLDASVEGNGWNAFAAFVGNNNDPDGPGDTSDYGAVVQGGIFVAPQWELFGRWDAVFLDNQSAGSDADLHFLTFGANYFLSPESHAAKFTGQIVVSLNETMGGTRGIGLPTSSTGMLGDTDSGEINFILGGQLVF